MSTPSFSLRWPSIVLLVGLLAGCAGPADQESGQLRHVRLTLNSPAGGQHAGFIYARKLGYYSQEGLDVSIDEGHGSRETAESVATGRSDFGYADALAIVQTRAAGGRLTVVSTLLQASPYAILSLASRGIAQPTDLRGKTIGVPVGTPAGTLLGAVLEANLLSPAEVTIMDLGADDLVAALRSGRIAAIVGTRDFHALQLRQLGERVVELPFQDVGAPLVGLSVAANDDLIQSDPRLVASFVRASLRGWDAARRNPVLAGRAVTEQFLAGYEEEVVTQLRAELPLLCSPHNEVIGLPSDDAWRATVDLLARSKLLASGTSSTDYYTPRFIPADAPGCP